MSRRRFIIGGKMGGADLNKGLLFHASFKESFEPEVGTLIGVTSGNPRIVYDNTLNRNTLLCDPGAIAYDPSTLPLGDVPFSISLWTKINSYMTHSGLLAWGIIPWQPTVKMIIISEDSGNPIMSFSPNGSPACGFKYTYGQWYHVVGVYPGDKQPSTLYVNKQIVDQQNTDWSKHQENEHFEIGLPFWAHWDRNDSYIANVRIYNRALPENEVALLYDGVL